MNKTKLEIIEMLGEFIGYAQEMTHGFSTSNVRPNKPYYHLGHILMWFEERNKLAGFIKSYGMIYGDGKYVLARNDGYGEHNCTLNLIKQPMFRSEEEDKKLLEFMKKINE